MWDSILEADPDLLLLLGDNVYVDRPDLPTERADFDAAYAALAAQPGWQRLRGQVPVLATWDDHDYGLNDAGAEFPLKQVAKGAFVAFFGEPAASHTADREGIYHSVTLGPVGQRVQVILLDTRTFRGTLPRRPAGRRLWGVGGRYMAGVETAEPMLGEAQWAWLAEVLQEPAEVRILASSIQVVADEHGWETWGNLPVERERLYRLIDETQAEGVVLVSGDRHLTELSVEDDPAAPYPLWDLTSSGLTQGERPVEEPNRHRRGGVFREAHFGLVSIDWAGPTPAVTLETRRLDGSVLVGETVPLDRLRKR